MTMRRFNQRQRRILAWKAAGKCCLCGQLLSNDFHADHVVAIKNGGLTVTSNGQALCGPCNQRKGAK